jgi:hypothetical protein
MGPRDDIPNWEPNPFAEVEPGDELETVLLSGFSGRYLRFWHGDNRPETVEVVDPSPLESLLWRGVLARTSPEPGRFREVALLNAPARQLVLLERPRRQEGQEETVNAGVSAVLSFTPCGEPEPSPPMWREAGHWLCGIVTQAAARGEFVVVDQGGWEPGTEPYALFCVLHQPDGEFVSHVEASPAPVSELWPPPTHPGTSLDAPAHPDNVSAAGLLLADAASTWARTPLDIVLTFGASPAGPFPKRGQSA